jgi:hypothetical protein
MALAQRSPSMVVLPQLPAVVRDVLVDHDQKILQIFTGYTLACATQLEKDGRDSLLPLSKTSYPLRSSPHPSSIFRTCLGQTALHVVARSQFVANSGHTDSFSSVEELARTARSDLHLNNNAIPSLKHLTTPKGEHALNAYLLDFYIHGQVAALVKANGIRGGDIWYLLQDFTLVLATIENSLKQLLIAVSGFAKADDPQSHDPAEMEEEELEGDNEHSTEGFERPAGVSDSDWALYTVANGALRDFNEKFKAMWA